MTKVFLASLGNYKDACEALQARDAEAIRQAIWNKRKYQPRSLIDGRSIFDLVSSPLAGKDADYPFPGLNQLTGGLRRGEMVTWTAGSGVGKYLYESTKRTGLRLITVVANKPLHFDN